MNTQEILIPVPWGHISAKLWGEQSQRERVLCVHGLQDNCGSFDRLIPLLDRRKVYLCVDLPNHGHSSGTPLGTRWTHVDYVICLKRIVDHLRWPDFCALGHSMGGQILTIFAAVYPEHVSRLVVLDTAGPIPVEPDELVPFARRAFDSLLSKENGPAFLTAPPTYTRAQAFALIKHRFYGPMTDEAAEALLVRSAKRGSDGMYSFNADQRLKVTNNPMLSPESHLNVVKSVKCPTLLIRAKDSVEYYGTIYKQVFDMFETNPYFVMTDVEGNHDVHLSYPERVYGIINRFLNEKLSKL
ncbi:probable serine hydrolase isoform X1 [Adelges cooleyi]|uniref:probable serine hydrolase isoform X1 n=1 Tax=Adelges cooleyi TaxID=133065 RepID=UPI00217F9180|nr:probable serine hydrolase isoform X1 [Adelges cooleyi]